MTQYYYYMIKHIENLYIKANRIFYAIKTWFDNNLLEINLNKTKHVIFNIKHINIDCNLKLIDHSLLCLETNDPNCSCKIIEKVVCIKYLGLYIDSKLKWNNQINYLTQQLRKFFYVFQNLINILTKKKN